MGNGGPNIFDFGLMSVNNNYTSLFLEINAKL